MVPATRIIPRFVLTFEGRGGGRGSPEWGTGEGWESDDASANETRLRLLTLQGQWLEIEGRMLSEPNSVGKVSVGVLPSTLNGVSRNFV